jgi:flagellar basal-body rod protein FlgG
MQHILSIALAAMHQDMQRMDRVAVNLANVSTPGYKREIAEARPFVDVMEGVNAADAGRGISSPSTAPLSVMFDSRPGTLKTTGQPFDVALTGDGFFEVSTENGPAYTRQGNFRIDARGRLVTAQGDPVMGKNGDIYLTTQHPVIDEAGNITEPDATTGPSATAPGTPVAQLKVVTFEQPAQMQHLGAGLMAAGTGMTVLSDGDARLRQGALENANVSSMQEMVQMIQTMRHFESMQKAVQGYDEMLGTAIHKLGDLS